MQETKSILLEEPRHRSRIDGAEPAAMDSALPNFSELSYQVDISDFGYPTVADQENVLYGSSVRDVADAAKWLSKAPQNCVVRITGGCLLMNSERVEAVQTFVEQALSGYRGVLISGDTVSVNSEDPLDVRPCMPEVGPRVAEANPYARHLGVFPGESLVLHQEDRIEIGKDFVDGKLWEIQAHSRPGRRMAVRERGQTFWQPERDQIYNKILPALDRERPPAVIAVIGHDGGVDTEAEYRQAAALSLIDSRFHIFLITGGGEARATDSLANDKEFLRKHPNVHVVEQDLLKFRRILEERNIIEVEP